MKIGVDENGSILLTEVYSGVGFKTSDGESLGVCMRDSGYEFNYMGTWYEAKGGSINKLENNNVKNEPLDNTNDSILNELLDVPFYTIGNFTIDVNKRLILINDESKKLTSKELHLLIILGANANTIVNSNFFIELIWGEYNYYNARCMDVYMCKLRKLLSDDPRLAILKINGEGYKLISPITLT